MNKNLPFSLFLALFFFVASVFESKAQCPDGRYQNRIFPNAISVTSLPSAVVYGEAENYQGNMETLDMYVAQPQGDVQATRPLVIMAFGGSFLQGVKESPDIIYIINELTRRGYVTASIKYRLGASPVNTTNMMAAVIRGVHDMRAAVRFFYKDADTDNNYRIDTTQIFIGGVSAGGFIGLHAAFLQDDSVMPSWMQAIVDSLGGYEGNSGNPGYSSKVKGVINLSGAIGDTAWITPTNAVPVLNMHGDQDGTVPFNSDTIVVSGQRILDVDGSNVIKDRLNDLGVYNIFHNYVGQDHVPFVQELPFALIGLPTPHLDATIDSTVKFLLNLVECDSTVSTNLSIEERIFTNIYPNPSENLVNIEIKNVDDFERLTMDIYDGVGRLVQSVTNLTNSVYQLNKDEFGAGIYFVNIYEGNKQFQVTKKVIFK